MYFGVALVRARDASWLRALGAGVPLGLAISSFFEGVAGGEDLDLLGSGVCVRSTPSVVLGGSGFLPGVEAASLPSVLLGL